MARSVSNVAFAVLALSVSLFAASAVGQAQVPSAQAAGLLANPTILSTLMGLISQGVSLGSTPGAASSLAATSQDNQYCLFATQPFTAPPAAAAAPLPAGGAPDTFGCVAAGAGVVAGPNSFPIVVGGQEYICQGAPSETPAGRKLLQQAQSPTSAAIGNALSAIGLPIWNCIVATTPAGNTTLGQASLAVLNDLGVVAEHLLVYLNANGALTYEQDIVNDFVSLTNPLYPTGPRLNFSIDFASLDKDHALFKEIFGKPAPVPPPTPAPTQTATPDVPAVTSAPADNGTPSDNSQSGGTTTPSDASGSQGTASPTPTETTAPAEATTSTTLTAFDGYVDNCQIVIGSIPHADGNFDRNNNFTAVITNGSVSMTQETTNQYNGQVTYIIPASKATEYPALTAETRSTAQFCNDIATLEPVYNPLATVISANASGLSANPMTTVATFGQSYGLTADALAVALGVTIPNGASMWSYDALSEASGGSADALAVLKANVLLANTVTAGANMLTNDSALYASFAIIMNQAIAKKVLYSPPTGGRRLLQTGPPAVDLTNATTLASIMTIAAQLVPTQSDAATVAALIQGLTAEQISAVALAVANLNGAVAASTDAQSAEKGSYYAQTELASQVNELAAGSLSVQDFTGLTTSAAIGDALTKTTLPGTVVPVVPAPPTPPPTVVPQTQSSTGSTQSSPANSDSGLSHGGKVALATILPICGVIAIVAVAAFLITRRNRGTYEETNNSTVWWRRPFARSGASAGPSRV